MASGASSAPPPGGAAPELTARRSAAARSALVTLADWWRRTRGWLIQGFEVQRRFEDADLHLGGAAPEAFRGEGWICICAPWFDVAGPFE